MDNILLSKQNNIIDEKISGGIKILISKRIYLELLQHDTSQSLNVGEGVGVRVWRCTGVGADMGVINEKTVSPTLNLAVGII